MSVAAVLDRGRAAAESLMQDTCVITSGGKPVFDPVTKTRTTPAGTTLYSGKCEARIRNVAAANPEFAGRQVVTEQSVVAIPVSAPHIPPGATVTFTAVADHSDPALLETSFTVLGGGKGSRITARRLNVEEASG